MTSAIVYCIINSYCSMSVNESILLMIVLTMDDSIQFMNIFWFFFTKVLHVEQETTPECYKQKYNHKKQDPYTYSVEKIKE